MKIKSWISGLKRLTQRVHNWMVTGGANNSDDWWRHSGRFPGDW